MSGDRRQYLLGFGGALAVALGAVVGLLVSNVIGAAWTSADSWLASSGASVSARVWFTGAILAVGWFGMWFLVIRFVWLRRGLEHVERLRAARGNWRTFAWATGAMALLATLFMLEPVRPTSPALIAFFGEPGWPWYGLFVGTPREWLTWLLLAITWVSLLAISRRKASDEALPS